MHGGDRWLSTPSVGGPPVILTHDTCGHDLAGDLRCAHCHEPVSARDLTLRDGPGAQPPAIARAVQD